VHRLADGPVTIIAAAPAEAAALAPDAPPAAVGAQFSDGGDDAEQVGYQV
jgi:hypothetical protein